MVKIEEAKRGQKRPKRPKETKEGKEAKLKGSAKREIKSLLYKRAYSYASPGTNRGEHRRGQTGIP